MFTLLLAWINAKYKSKYKGLFIATFVIDIGFIDAMTTIFSS